MLLATRRQDVGLYTGAVTQEIARTSRIVSRLTGYPVQPNKAIIGRNAFAHESGIHQDGVLKERTTYEIMDPRSVGLEANSIVLGKHSGRHALQQTLADLGFDVSGQALNIAFKRFKEIADKKKQVTAMDLEALLTDEIREDAGVGYSLDGSRSRRARVAHRTPASGSAARRTRSSRARSPATARSTRSSTRSTPPPAPERGSASSASTRSPVDRMRSARSRSCSRSTARPVRDRAFRPNPGSCRPRLRARTVERDQAPWNRRRSRGGDGTGRAAGGQRAVADPELAVADETHVRAWVSCIAGRAIRQGGAPAGSRRGARVGAGAIHEIVADCGGGLLVRGDDADRCPAPAESRGFEEGDAARHAPCDR